MFLGGYGLYLLFSLPALLLGLWAQLKVKSAFNQYSRVRSFTGLTGAEVARRMLNSNGLTICLFFIKFPGFPTGH